MILNNFQISKNFNLREFQSRDTQEVKISAELVRKLQIARDLLGIPIHIVSGYRTPEYNEKVGGVKNSYHTQGLAVDITSQSVGMKAIVIAAIQAGFSKIIAYNDRGFIHLDIGDNKGIIVPQKWFDDIKEFSPNSAFLLSSYEEYVKKRKGGV